MLIIISFTLINCQKEENFTEEIDAIDIEKPVEAKRVTLTEIKQNPELKKVLQKVEKRFDYNKKTDLNAKINSTDNSFSILTDEIIEVSTDSTVAYTFRIETPTHDDSDFENFVISRLFDNDFQFHIYKYKEPEIIEEEVNYLIVSREQVNEDQIDLGDFDEFINSKMFYDAESECLLDIMSLGGVLYIDILFCDLLMEGGGMVGVGGGMIINGSLPSGATAQLYDCSEPYSINADGICQINCSLINGNGAIWYNESNQPLQYVVEVPCLDNNASNNDNNTGSGSNSTGTGTGDTSSNDTNTNEAGSGGTSPNSDTETDNDTTGTVGVLPIIFTDEIVDYYNLNEVGTALDPEELGYLTNSLEGQTFCKDLYKFLQRENESPEATAFGELAIEAFLNGGELSFKELYVEVDTPDDDFNYIGQKQRIPNPLILANGSEIEVTFITYTNDGLSSDQEVADLLIDGLKYALEEANTNLSESEKITSVNIYTTTNGNHTGPNHYNGTAFDINRINGVRMAESGVTNQIIELQKAFDNFQYIRENFGPYFKHKYFINSNTWNYNWPVAGHSDHIHISVRN